VIVKARLTETLTDLMLTPGLSGHEDRVRRLIAAKLLEHGLEGRTDTLGNLIVSFEGDSDAPSVMVYDPVNVLAFVHAKRDRLARKRAFRNAPEPLNPDQPIGFDLADDESQLVPIELSDTELLNDILHLVLF